MHFSITHLCGRLSAWLILALLCTPLVLALIGRTVADKFPAADLHDLLHRWRWLARYGLQALRQRWWLPLGFESRAVVWHYAFSAECWALANLAHPPLPPGVGERILVIRVGHPGDFLHAVPCLRTLRQQKPHATIHLVVAPGCRELALRCAYVDAVHEYQPALLMHHRGKYQWWRGALREYQLLRLLRRQRFHVCFALEAHHIVDVVLMEAVFPGSWFGLRQRLCPYGFAVPRKELSFAVRQPEAEMLMDLLGLAGLVRGSAKLEFPLSSDDRLWAKQWQKEVGLLPGHYVVMAPGAGWPGKRWPAERFSMLADWIWEYHRLRTVLLGSQDETPLADMVVSNARHGVISVIGRTSLVQAATILEKARLYVGNDSALLHVAVAVGRPTVALFGPTFREKWAPCGDHHQVIQHRDEVCQFSCHSWHLRIPCMNNMVCMDAISVQEVKVALEDFLAQDVYIEKRMET